MADEAEATELAELVASVASQAAAQVVTQFRESFFEWSGPVPSPEDLQAFENIKAGSAERIMVLAEERASHLVKSQMRELDIEEQRVAGANRANEIARDVSVRAINSHTYTTVLFLIAAVTVALTVGAWPGVILGAAPLSRYLFMVIQEARGRRGEE